MMYLTTTKRDDKNKNKWKTTNGDVKNVKTVTTSNENTLHQL